MNPTIGDVHVNQALTNFSLAFTQDSVEWAADRAAPIYASDKKTDSYFVFDRADWFRDDMKIRGPGARAAEIDMRLSQASYVIESFTASIPLPDMIQDNADEGLALDQSMTQLVTLKERIRREKAFAAATLVGSVWTGIATGVAGTPSTNEVKQWSAATSTPLGDISAQKTAVQLLTGYRPNVFTCGQQVADALLNHPEIVDRIKYGASSGSPAKVTLEAVASLMGLKEIIVMGGIEATNNEGATLATAFIGGKKGLLTYRADVPGKMTATAVTTFTWKRPGATDLGTRIKRYYSDERESTIIEMNSGFVHKIVAPDLGVYFPTLVA